MSYRVNFEFMLQGLEFICLWQKAAYNRLNFVQPLLLPLLFAVYAALCVLSIECLHEV